MFENLKILELASVLAGPGVGQFFAELGAEVIKIENLATGGDVTRTWKSPGEAIGDRSAYFCSCNWGKKSVALDLTTAEGKSNIKKLASRCDIIIASYKPGDAEKLGVSYNQLAIDNQQLIYGQITGYGSDNDRVGYDAVIQAESGFMDLNGEKAGPPTKMPVALIDILAGHQLKEGILLALLSKERTGKGTLVEVSLIQSAIASLANQATNYLLGKKIPSRQGSLHPNIAPYGDVFETKDKKKILIAVGSDRQFRSLVKILYIENPYRVEFATNQKRVENREALKDLLAKSFSRVHSSEVLALLHREKVPAGLIQNVKEVFEMKEAEQMVLRNESLSGVRNFAAFSKMWHHPKTLLPPPRLGEHTDEILNSLL